MRRIIKLIVCLVLISPGLFGLAGERKGMEINGGETVFSADASIVYEAAGKPELVNREGEKVKPEPLEAAGQPVAACPQKIVYLTFDDGPSKHTADVLDLLKREGIKATFFVLGENVKRNPDIVQRIVEEGHSLGNHTYDHKYEVLYGSFSSFAAEIIATEEAINEAAGIRTSLVRAPGGTYSNFDQGYFDALAAAGYKVHDWNVDSGDSKRRGVPAAEIAANIKASKLKDKLNVLLHDGSGHEQSVKALPEIISYYKNLGYAFMPIAEQDEPMQFKVAQKLKWSRAAVTEAQMAMLADYARDARHEKESLAVQTADYKVLPDAETLPACSIKGIEDAVHAGAAAEAAAGPDAGMASAGGKSESGATPYLSLYRGKEALQLAPHEYVLIDGSIQVPLRKLMAWIGAELRCDPIKAEVEGYMNGKTMRWSIDTAAATQNGGDLQVPLRATLKSFGIEISDYIYNAKQRAVWINP